MADVGIATPFSPCHDERYPHAVDEPASEYENKHFKQVF
jgi:hypothetical protein